MSYYDDSTPDLVDALENLYRRFAAGLVNAGTDDDLVVSCPDCAQNGRGYGGGACNDCRSWRPRRRRLPRGFSLQMA